MTFYLTFWEIAGFILIALLVLLTIFAIIEPGPLERRSRDRRGRPASDDASPPPPSEEADRP